MKKRNPIEYLTGFFMGTFLGFFLEGAFIAIYNLVCTGLGRARLDLAWWMWLPVPLLVGLVMGRTIADLHLEDY